MSSSSPAGKALTITGNKGDEALVLAFALATVESKVVNLNPAIQYGVFINQASATDFVTAATHDDSVRAQAGNAIYNANVTQANVTADGFLGATPIGASALKITTNRRAAASDNATIVTALGGYRCVVRIVPLTVPLAAGLTMPSAPVLAVPFA
ncbi:MAG: hypothetical protein RSE62_03130 [Citrobacter sp.]